MQSNGVFQRMQMEDVFWSRTRSMMKMAELVVVALMPPNVSQGRIDKVMSVYREMNEMLFPHEREERVAREEKLKTLMALPDFMEPFHVTPIGE